MLVHRTVVVLIALWSLTVIGFCVWLGIFNTPFFHFGPSKSIKIFDYPINNWYKWSAVCIYIVLNQILTTCGLETITPWMLNQVQNLSVDFLVGDTRSTALWTIGIWYFWLWLSRIVSIQLVLTQIDFLLVILFVDISTTLVTTHFVYLRKKQTNFLPLTALHM